MKKIYNVLMVICCFVSQIFTHEKIRMYALYTPSHQVLKDEFFLPSLQDDFELIIEFCEQTCPSAKFMSEGWTQTTIRKVDLILRAIEENWGSFFIFSDVDIQFFAPIKKIILDCIRDKDMVIQKNSPSGVLCSGFFVCRANEKTLRLWQDVKKTMMQGGLYSDQNSLNHCIKRSSKKNPYDIVWGYLPITFFGAGVLTGREWFAGMPLFIPDNIVMHHANWTKGINNKIAQLKYVRAQVVKRKKKLSKR